MKPSAYLTSDLLDILFEYKNKSYGAYELRQTYSKRLKKSLLFTSSFVIACTIFFVILHRHKVRIIPPPSKNIELASVDIKQPEPPPVLPPEPPAAPKMAPQIKYTQINVVKDELVRPEEQPPNLLQIQQHAISTRTTEGDINGSQVALTESADNGITGNKTVQKPFIFVQQMPHFPGTTTDEASNRKAMEFISRHIEYPVVAREQGITGVVVVQFVVGSDGALEDIHIVSKDPGGGLAKAAMEVISKMPKWTPGRQNGRNVPVQFTLPIRFSLQQN